MLGIGWLALLAAGCSTYQVQTDFNPQFIGTAWHTYAWMQQEPVTAPEGTAAFGNPINQHRVRAAIEAEFAAKGLTRVEDVALADGVVRYAIGTRDRLYWSDPYWGVGMGWGWGWGGWPYGYGGYGGYGSLNYGPYSVTEARLAVDLFDAKTHEAVWHGTVSLESSKLSGDAAASEIGKAVHVLMQYYPPGSQPPKKQ